MEYMSTKIQTTDDVVGFPGAIRRVDWVMRWSNPELYGNNHVIEAAGDTKFDLASLSTDTYVAIADVTETQIKNWIVTLCANYDEFVEHHETALAESYDQYTLTTHSEVDHIESPNFV